MTRRRGQKRRIRERMAKTGETYSTARARLVRSARGRVSSMPVVMVPVTDLDRAIAFYKDELGFDVLKRNAEGSWAELGDDSVRIGLHAGSVTTGVDTGLGLLRRHEPATKALELITIHDPDGNLIRVMR